MSENEEIMREFIVESLEALDKLDRELLALEERPGDGTILNSIFRIVHTIKGTCGFIGFAKLEALTHKGESLLGNLRDGDLKFTKEMATAFLRLADAVRSMLTQIEKTGSEGDGDYTALAEELIRLNQPQHEAPPVEAPVAKAPAKELSPEDADLESAFEAALQEYQDAQAPTASSPTTVQSAPSPSQLRAQPQQSAPPPSDEERKGGGIADTSLRVDVSLLDQLMNLVGELVLARNQILQFTKNQSDAGFLSTSQRLNLVTSELQEGVMRTRMQPIANVWNKFPRVVRDVARACGKDVRIEMEGKETDLDKTIIEAIKDPLTHVVRNAVDHGIEHPDARLAKGKPAQGVLTLRAFHEGGHVIIEIADDGAGLNTGRIKSKAVEKGLITLEQASKLSEQDAHKLIFLPGFSTAEQVTNISGRGVGMDVVKSNIEKIGGEVDVSSRPGDGTTLKIKIPLTLAIVPALIVSCQGHRFAIPQVSLVELVRIEASQANDEIEEIHGALFYRLRGSLLPLVYLSHELNLRAQRSEDEAVRAVNIVVVRADQHLFGLVVDVVHDTEEIVVKPLQRQLKDVPVFAGATIMGDGKVALIVDISGVAQRARIDAKDASEERAEQNHDASSGEREALLVLRVGEHQRAAMPLCLVDRLERFQASKIETGGGRPVVQYRGGILPLVNLAQFFGSDRMQDEGSVQVVVYSDEGRSVGLVVDEVVDIVEEHLLLQGEERPGIRGSAVINSVVTDILKVEEIIR